MSVGTMPRMDDITEKYLALEERISRYPVTDPAARVRMLTEIEVIYRRERAAREATLPGRAATPAGQGGK